MRLIRNAAPTWFSKTTLFVNYVCQATQFLAAFKCLDIMQAMSNCFTILNACHFLPHHTSAYSYSSEQMCLLCCDVGTLLWRWGWHYENHDIKALTMIECEAFFVQMSQNQKKNLIIFTLFQTSEDSVRFLH